MRQIEELGRNERDRTSVAHRLQTRLAKGAESAQNTLETRTSRYDDHRRRIIILASKRISRHPYKFTRDAEQSRILNNDSDRLASRAAAVTIRHMLSFKGILIRYISVAGKKSIYNNILYILVSAANYKSILCKTNASLLEFQSGGNREQRARCSPGRRPSSLGQLAKLRIKKPA